MTCRIWSLVLPLAWMGCNASAGPIDDAGPPGFEVLLEHAEGGAIEEGDELEVTFGCQGGVHVNFGVIAIGDGIGAGATLEANLFEAQPLMRDMNATADGAERTNMRYVLRDYVFDTDLLGLPRDEPLRVTVTRVDGESVTVQRTVRLVAGDACTGGCQYADTPGTATITAISAPTTTGCAEGNVEVAAEFTADEGGSAELHAVERIAPACMEALGLAVGAEVPAVHRQIVPGTGSCTPDLYELRLDRAPCESVCPP